MPRVVSFEEAKTKQYRNKDEATNIPFLPASKEAPHLPVAFLSKRDLGRAIGTHWHAADEFQIIAEGRGTLGNHAVSPFCIHYARAYTPYGPLQDDGESPIAFFTLRTRYDPGGPRFLPETKDELQQIPNRRPWQVSAAVSFAHPGRTGGEGVVTQEIPGFKDDQGLFACSLSMAPGSRATAPDPSKGGGQYLVVVRGGLWHNDKEHGSFTVVFVEPSEGPFRLHAGAEGLEAIVLNFPRSVGNPSPIRKSFPGTSEAADSKGKFKTYQCTLCAFVYEEVEGIPLHGIQAGTRWEDVPENFGCPDCDAKKSDFAMIEF